MKQTKKQSWINIIQFSSLVIIFLYFISSYFNSPPYICSKTPEKCVCEEKLKINQTTYRLKTECEKGNPDWVEEPACVEYNLTEGVCGYTKEQVDSACTLNQTICRKLMLKS